VLSSRTGPSTDLEHRGAERSDDPDADVITVADP